jgi:hypothetical protein
VEVRSWIKHVTLKTELELEGLENIIMCVNLKNLGPKKIEHSLTGLTGLEVGVELELELTALLLLLLRTLSEPELLALLLVLL